MKNLSYIFKFFLFFTLFYSETISIGGGLKISQLWKGILIVGLLVYIIYSKVKTFRFNKASYLLAFKQLINEGLFSSFVANVVEFFRFLNFPVLIHSIDIYFKTPQKLYKFVVTVSQYFLLTAVPVLLGLVKSVRDGVEFGDETSYTGIFQSSHSASIITCLSLFVVINHIRTIKLSKIKLIFNSALVVVGLYCLYTAFVRTGYLMFVIGMIIMFMPQKISAGQIIKLSLITIFLGVSFVWLIDNNDAFKQRIFDQNKKGEQREVGSGRLVFMKLSVDYWVDSDPFGVFFGKGIENITNNLQRKLGAKIKTHNGYVDVLVINGVFGLLIFIVFLGSVFIFVLKNKAGPSYPLVLAMFISYIVFQATQGGVFFHVDLIMTSCLVLLNKERNLLSEKAILDEES